MLMILSMLCIIYPPGFYSFCILLSPFQSLMDWSFRQVCVLSVSAQMSVILHYQDQEEILHP